jgi:signal transduction histidine kinase
LTYYQNWRLLFRPAEDKMKKMGAKPLQAVGAGQLHRLLEISMVLGSTLDLKELLRRVINAATELIGTEVASILLVEPKTGELYIAAASGDPLGEDSSLAEPPVEGTLVPFDGSIAGWIIREGQPLILDDVQADERHFTGVDEMNHFTTRTMLGVPLVTKGRVIGALEAINKRTGAYTEEDVALLQAIAAHAAVAIENARLFQQSDLVAEIMHELKTPLTALTAASDLLAHKQLPEERRSELLQMIQRETRRLSQMTHDFLDLARLESGRIQLVRRPIDLAELVADVVHIQQPQAVAAGVTLSGNVAEGTPSLVGDYNRLKQVLLNLVSNAIKYNVPQGCVWIQVRSERPDEVMLVITDTGPGIPADRIHRLFERFYRLPDSEGFSEGTGLGLSIARKIVEEHNGRIQVESEMGQGTSFRCCLPV